MAEIRRGVPHLNRKGNFSPALVWASRITFYNSYALVSGHTLVARYSSVRIYQTVSLRIKPQWLMPCTPAQ